MELVSIPEKLEEFNVQLLDKLITIPSIESETFDFKEEPSELHEDMCAMANVKGGFLVLGIGQIKGKDDKTLIGFKKIGFKKGEEDLIGNKINTYRFRVDPTPNVTLNHIYEDDGSKFYTVIKIESRISEKPYFVKNTDQCYVRIHSSSQRVGRTAILNIHSSNVELRNNVERLKMASVLLKESLLHTSSDISAVNVRSTMKIAPLDLTFIRNAIISCELFLKENDIIGLHKDQSSYSEGFNSILYSLESLNTYLEAFNRENIPDTRQSLHSQFSYWGTGFGSNTRVTDFLDKVIKLADTFLTKYV